LVVPFTFWRFDLSSSSTTAASAASASTTVDVDTEGVSAGTGGGVGARIEVTSDVREGEPAHLDETEESFGTQ